jgi:cell division protein FtsW
MYITHKINHRYICAVAKTGLYISVILLLFVWKFGFTVNEASRWLTIPFIHTSFQPSEFAQLFLLCYIANSFRFEDQAIIEERQKSVLIWVVVICGLITLTNFSRSILLFTTSMMMMYLGGYSLKKSLKNGMIMSAVVCIVALGLGQRGKTIVNRLKGFNQTELPCQTYQANIAIANGKLFGKGPGNSMQRNFLPYAYSDYIFPIIIEEYGFFGGVLTLLLYLILVFRGMKILDDDRYSKISKLLSVGLSFFIAIEALVNIGVAVGILPSTGIPLPLISMGGTSSIFTSISFGIILNSLIPQQKDFFRRKNQFH